MYPIFTHVLQSFKKEDTNDSHVIRKLKQICCICKIVPWISQV